MSLTRKSLKDLALTEEQIEAVIAMHGETVSALKAQIDQANDAAEAQRGVNQALQAEYDGYRAETARAALRREKEAAYRALLAEAGVGQKRHDAILRVTDLDALPMEDGAFLDPDGLKRDIRAQWEDFIPKTRVEPAPVAAPPANTVGGLTREAILAIRDKEKKRAAIAENLELFQ